MQRHSSGLVGIFPSHGAPGFFPHVHMTKQTLYTQIRGTLLLYWGTSNLLHLLKYCTNRLHSLKQPVRCWVCEATSLYQYIFIYILNSQQTYSALSFIKSYWRAMTTSPMQRKKTKKPCLIISTLLDLILSWESSVTRNVVLKKA